MLLIQIPEEVPKPHQNDPLDFTSATELILYVGLPLLFIFLYYLWKRSKKQ
ncbi:adenylosuccinate synthetase [Robertkochia sediminum]|uniref:adenylosuccinate synthetase n=1 Tax=Robertkochia sediminum TaxID=2785326 RepID=UPI001932E170|nr:adenylosuccinate synthetase [Robertkochia sediminum]MBL7474035.1 adenylosuccinate synthetase [Robertkochia sediminum]